MKTIKTLVFTSFMLLAVIGMAQAMSLDEIYRDIVKADNRGYLPMFVKNRAAPDFEDNHVDLSGVPDPAPDDNTPVNPDLEIVKLENQRKIREEKLKAELARWHAVVENVKAGNVTPVELRALEVKADDNNPLAVEILAWVYARGVGVQPDLVKAFVLYQRAAALGVADAQLNAAKVYKAMPRHVRETLITYQ